jgi:hypothetical protein
VNQDFENLIKAVEFTQHLMNSFLEEQTAPGIRNFLKTVYDAKILNREKEEDARFMDVADKVDSTIAELEEIPDIVKIERIELFQLFLNILRSSRYYLTSVKSAINLEGWLELLWGKPDNCYLELPIARINR